MEAPDLEARTPERKSLEASENFSGIWIPDVFKTPQGTGQVRSLRSPAGGFSSPRTSSPRPSGLLESLDSELLRNGTRRENGKQSNVVQSIWILALVGLIFISFLLLFTSFAGDYKQPALRVKNGYGFQSFRGNASFFPCDTVFGNPSCDEETPFKEKPPRDIDTRQALDYVSKRDPPPGFEHWIKFATENQCLTGSYSRIEKDMEAFRDRKSGQLRILRHHIEGAKAMDKTATFVVKNGSVESSGDDKHSQTKFRDLMSRFVSFLPDMEFVVNVMDEPRVLPGNTEDVDERMASPVCYNASHSFRKHRNLHGFINNRQTGPNYDPNPELVALFSQTKINECHRDIMFPTLYTLESQLPPEDEDRLIPWSSRKDVLFFRGTTTGGLFSNSKTEGLSHRQRLVQYAKGQPHMDIGFTGVLQCTQEVCNDMEVKYGLVNKVPYMENFDHKYLVSIDGNTFVSRLPRFMQSASLMFRVGLFDEWFEEWLQEGKHYLRVALDYSDLKTKLNWAIDNDAQAKKIGLEARDFSKKHLRKQDMECYLFRLLLEYANILEL